MADGDEKTPTWRWLTIVLIAIVGSAISLYISTMNAADAKNEKNIDEVKIKQSQFSERMAGYEATQRSIVDKIESIDKRSERIENKLDRIGK